MIWTDLIHFFDAVLTCSRHAIGIFRKNTRFSSVLGVSLRFFTVFQFLDAFWHVLGVSLEFRWWNIVDFSIFRRFSMIFDDFSWIWSIFSIRFWHIVEVTLRFLQCNLCVLSYFFVLSKCTICYSVPVYLCIIFRKIYSKNTCFFRRFSLIFNAYFDGHLADLLKYLCDFHCFLTQNFNIVFARKNSSSPL